MAEDDGVGAGEARAQPLQPPVGLPGVVDHRDPRAAGLDHARRGQRRRSSALVDVAVHGRDRRAERASSVEHRRRR